LFLSDHTKRAADVATLQAIAARLDAAYVAAS
jgi:hypothetical protein